MASRVSVVINTLNEEKNIANVLRSVSTWVHEIVVVDMYSEDQTVQIAQDYGAKVFLHERTGFVEAARRFAIEQASGDWVLVLDADEVIPAGLSRTLLRIAETDQADAVRIPWLNYLLGAPLQHTGWGPEQDKHVRFFKRGCLSATTRIHNGLTLSQQARLLDLPYRPGQAVAHFNYVDTAHFFEKMNRYTTVEAKQAFERGERSTWLRATYSALKEVARRYVKQGGYRDGWRGVYLSLFMGVYRLAIHAKLKELETMGARDAIQARYSREVSRYLNEYENDDHT